MDQDRLKKMYQKLLDESYNNRLVISEFRALPTQTYDNEKNEWVPDSHSIFIMIKDKEPQNLRELGICNLLEGVFGFECVIDFL
jgi:hypothetical protein